MCVCVCVCTCVCVCVFYHFHVYHHCDNVYSVTSSVHSWPVAGGSVCDTTGAMCTCAVRPDQTGWLHAEGHCGRPLHVLPHLERSVSSVINSSSHSFFDVVVLFVDKRSSNFLVCLLLGRSVSPVINSSNHKQICCCVG